MSVDSVRPSQIKNWLNDTDASVEVAGSTPLESCISKIKSTCEQIQEIGTNCNETIALEETQEEIKRSVDEPISNKQHNILSIENAGEFINEPPYKKQRLIQNLQEINDE